MRRIASDDGQAMVELAVVFLVLTTLIFGGLEFTRALNAWSVITAASREGARTAAVSCTIDAGCSTTVGTRVEDALVGVDLAAASWNVDPGPYVSGNPVTVNVQYTLTPLTPLIVALVPGGAFTLTSSATMRLE